MITVENGLYTHKYSRLLVLGIYSKLNEFRVYENKTLVDSSNFTEFHQIDGLNAVLSEFHLSIRVLQKLEQVGALLK